MAKIFLSVGNNIDNLTKKTKTKNDVVQWSQKRCVVMVCKQVHFKFWHKGIEMKLHNSMK